MVHEVALLSSCQEGGILDGERFRRAIAVKSEPEPVQYPPRSRADNCKLYSAALLLEARFTLRFRELCVAIAVRVQSPLPGR